MTRKPHPSNDERAALLRLRQKFRKQSKDAAARVGDGIYTYQQRAAVERDAYSEAARAVDAELRALRERREDEERE